MLMRTIIFAGVVAVLATQVLSLLERGSAPSGPISANRPSRPRPDPYNQFNLVGSAIRLTASEQRHYVRSFRINSKPVRGIINTGATFVAINENLAHHLGLGANQLGFRYAVLTAAIVQTSTVHVVLDRIKVSSIRVGDVEAVVVRDDALLSTLVGMSLLRKLDSYFVTNSMLNLKKK